MNFKIAFIIVNLVFIIVSSASLPPLKLEYSDQR